MSLHHEQWPVGLTLDVVASLFGILGKLFVKLAHVQANNWYFYLGVGCIVILNPGFSTASYHFASQSLLAPMAGLTIVWNTCISPFVVQEQAITKRDLVGACLIFMGCLAIAATAPHTTISIPLDEIINHLTSPVFLVYITLACCFIFVLALKAFPVLMLMVCPDKASYRHLLHSPSHGRSIGLSASMLAGFVAGQVFLISAVVKIVNDTTSTHESVWHHYEMYLYLLIAVMLALLGLFLLNGCLKYYDAIFVIYVYEAAYIVAGVISGICFSNDMKSFSLGHYVVYALSLVVIIVGIGIVSLREHAKVTTDSVPNEDKNTGVKQKLLP